MTLHSLLSEAGQSHPKSYKGAFYSPSAAHGFVLNKWLSDGKKSLAVITPTSRQSQEILSITQELNPHLEVIEFPAWETLPHERLSPSAETVGKRLRALHRLLELGKSKKQFLLLLSVRAALPPIVGGLEDHPPF